MFATSDTNNTARNKCFFILLCISWIKTIFKFISVPVEVLVDAIDVMHKVKQWSIEKFIPSHLHTCLKKNQKIHHHSCSVIFGVDGDHPVCNLPNGLDDLLI